MRGNVRRRIRGMTLVEVMVSLALLALLSVGIVSSFRLGERTYRQLTKGITADRDLATAQSFLRQVLETAYPFRPDPRARVSAFGLEGSETRLAVTAPMPRGAGGSGHYRYEFALETTADDSKNLVVHWSLDRNGTSAPFDGAARDASHSETLIEGLQTLEWSYLEPARPTDAFALGEPRWQSTWTQSRKPPSLVRLRVTFPPKDARRWPELLVAPRVTDDANCQFDMVSQACRET
jgi:general secretion pathway protein J